MSSSKVTKRRTETKGQKTSKNPCNDEPGILKVTVFVSENHQKHNDDMMRQVSVVYGYTEQLQQHVRTTNPNAVVLRFTQNSRVVFGVTWYFAKCLSIASKQKDTTKMPKDFTDFSGRSINLITPSNSIKRNDSEWMELRTFLDFVHQKMQVFVSIFVILEGSHLILSEQCSSVVSWKSRLVAFGSERPPTVGRRRIWEL